MPKWGKAGDLRRNQKERAIVLIAFHGFVLAQLVTNTSIKDLIVSMPPLPLVFGWSLPHETMGPMVMGGAALGAYCAYWALANSGSEDVSISKKVEGELQWSLLFSLMFVLLAGAYLMVSVTHTDKALKATSTAPESASAKPPPASKPPEAIQPHP